MSAQILKFQRPARKLTERKVDGATRVSGFASTLEARPDGVVFTVHNFQFELTAEQARELGATMIECADDSESLQTGPKA